ncbi:MAG: DUF3780 domain-containing protein [Deltaproteobacteria bacterium]|nr:DUF3780 domain-containing protein [Deltaproteobacteria bacterium]
MPARPKTLGFGFVPSESEHHFLVSVSPRKKEFVFLSEHFTWEESQEARELSFALGRDDAKIKVYLDRHKWDAIADAVRVEFNARLKKNGLKPGQWKEAQTPVSRLFGKELILLAWAIEDADPALIPAAIKNWLGLTPEERWWLFTMTNAATGHAVTGKNKGWRKAVRYALTENPVAEGYQPVRPKEGLFQLLEDELPWTSRGKAAAETVPDRHTRAGKTEPSA